MPPALQFLVLTFAGWVNRHQDDLIAYLREENRVLREHLGPRPLRLTDAQRRRLAVRGQKLGRRVVMQVAGIVTPDTILRWYRRVIAQTYDGSARRGRGRPMTRRDVAARVLRMAVENPQWGYTRIRGALSNLGHEIARTTVKRILHDHGIDPAPERSRRMPWKTFLQAHWEGLTACDLFTVEVLTLAGLQRYLVFFVIALQSRRVTIAGIHPQPYGTWMEQMARNLTDPVDGCLRRARYLIHDRDPLDTRGFGEILEGGGVQPIRLPPKSPNLNAYAERFVRSIKRGVAQSRRPPRRRALASPRGRVRRTRPSRAKPPGTRQPAPATTATAGEPGRRRSAAGASGRIAQFLPPGGRMSGRPIKRTLRGRLKATLWESEDSETLHTSFVERLNRTIRQGSAYLRHRSPCHARGADQLHGHVDLLRCYDNFIRPHRALKCGRETRTPAMQVGLVNAPMNWSDIFTAAGRSLRIPCGGRTRSRCRPAHAH